MEINYTVTEAKRETATEETQSTLDETAGRISAEEAEVPGPEPGEAEGAGMTVARVSLPRGWKRGVARL